MSVAPIANYRVWLEEQLAERRKRHPGYSLRAFSKSLGLSTPSLSQILSGKRPLSRKSALKIIHHGSLSPEEARALLASVVGLGADCDITASPEAGNRDFQQLEVDTFRVIADWYHYAILSLAGVRNNEASPEWIARRLGIPVKTARESFERLIKLGLIRRRGRGFYQSAKPLSTPTRRTSSALRKYHHQMLDKAKEALSADDAALEHFSSITMAVDERHLPHARELIRAFRRKLCETLEVGHPDRVYTLAVQLFPISTKNGVTP